MVRRLTTEEFIEKAIAIHGNNDEYCYENSIYTCNRSPIKIVCKKDGEFTVKYARNHINNSRQGCQKCLYEKRFIKTAKDIHGDLYCYDNTVYDSAYQPVSITCKKHGEFAVERAANHINEKQVGCVLCKDEKRKITFVEKAVAIHGDAYDYSNINYQAGDQPVDILCPQHGLFNIPFAQSHVNKPRQGCPFCLKGDKYSKLERVVVDFLDIHRLPFEFNVKFKTLGKKSYDFLVDGKFLIECDGRQHFEAVEWFGGQERFDFQKKSDECKNKWAANNGYPLLRIPYREYNNIEAILREFLGC